MIVDGRSLQAGFSFDADVCIVGGGTAGIVLARELMGRNVRVCLLESGGLGPEPETQSLAAGENIGFPYYPLDTARTRCFGGSSSRWHVPIGGDRVGARLRPLDPIDFEKRDWVPFSGWPFDHEHLAPYYQRAQSICRVEPPTFEADDWKDKQTRPTLPLPADEVQTIIYKFVARDLFAREYPDEVSAAENITVFLHANVLEIETNAQADCITRLRCTALEGSPFHVTAKFFVLAAGGIEVPRLLLLSNNVQRDGLGNEQDLVGRFFMEHPHFWQGIFVPTEPDFLESTALYNDVHTVKGVPVIGKLALTEPVIRREQLLNQNVQLVPQTMADPFKNRRARSPSVESLRDLVSATRRLKGVDHPWQRLRDVITGLDEIAVAAGRKIQNQFAATPRIPVFYFANMTEQIPNPQSRITLGDQRDRLGQRRATLNWKITAQDIRSVNRTQEIIAAALERAGLGRFYQEKHDDNPPADTEGGYHHMGTTRMDADPKQGVVDANCRMHTIGNLYIAGPSVFPTGGYANPVLTIIALTVRLADHLKKMLT